MKRGAVAALIVIASCALVLLMPRTSSAATRSVDISGFQFQPGSVTIAVGDTVTWRNLDGVPHSAVFGPNQQTMVLQPGASGSLTFSTAGTFNYMCGIHGASMSGTVVVQAGASSPPTTAPPTAPPTTAPPATAPPTPIPTAPPTPVPTAPPATAPPTPAPTIAPPTPAPATPSPTVAPAPTTAAPTATLAPVAVVPATASAAPAQLPPAVGAPVVLIAALAGAVVVGTAGVAWLLRRR